MHYYHYTLEKNIPEILQKGMFQGSSYAAEEYFSAGEAGQKLGVMPHYIDCVLKFKDDGMFKKQPTVASTGRFLGGGSDYTHSMRIRPVAMRKISEREWKSI
jgi:hypothetical protein